MSAHGDDPRLLLADPARKRTRSPNRRAALAAPHLDDMKLFACDWAYVNPLRPGLLEKYNQVFGS